MVPVEFLQGKLNTWNTTTVDPRAGNTEAKYYELHEISHCIFERRFSAKIYGTDGIADRYFNKFDASKMDPSKVRVHSGRVTLAATENHQIVDMWDIKFSELYSMWDMSGYSDDCPYQGSNDVCEIEGSSYKVTFDGILSPSDENARRVAKAFEHLIRLCGGEEELF